MARRATPVIAALAAIGFGLAGWAVSGLELDPLSGGWQLLSYASGDLGNLQDAERCERRFIELRPLATSGYYSLGSVLLAEGDAQGALAAFEQATEPNWRTSGVPLGLDAVGRHEEAEAMLQVAVRDWGNSMAYQIACVYAQRRDLDHAFEWLERAYRRRDQGLNAMKVDPILAPIRLDPRYPALLKKMNLPL